MIGNFTKISWVAVLCFIAGNAECYDMNVRMDDGVLKINDRIGDARFVCLPGNVLAINDLQGVETLNINIPGYNIILKGNNTINTINIVCNLFDNSSNLKVTNYNITAPKVINRLVWDASGTTGIYDGSMKKAVESAVDQDGFTNLGVFLSPTTNATNMQILNRGEAFGVKKVNHKGKHKTVWWESEKDYSGITFDGTKRIIVMGDVKTNSKNKLPPVVSVDANSRELLQIMYDTSKEKKEERIIEFLKSHRDLKSQKIGTQTLWDYASGKYFTKLKAHLTPTMAYKIWRQLIQTLIYRKDLADAIRPFFDNLYGETAKEKYNINDDQHFQFLRNLPDYQLKVLHQHKIISDEKMRALEENAFDEIWQAKETFIDGLDQNTTKRVIDAIKADNLSEFQKVMKGIDHTSLVHTSFNEVQEMAMHLTHYCITQNAVQCFRFLISNNSCDLAATMREQTYEVLHRYEWNCMALAIYFGNIEIAKILEEHGIKKESSSSHLEAAILSYRNETVKQLLDMQKDGINLVKMLIEGIFMSAKNNNIECAEWLIERLSSKELNDNFIDENGKTPLNYATECNFKEINEVLVSKGADVDFRSDGWGLNEIENWTLLHWIAKNNCVEIGKILISKGADINAKDERGKTPLHYAATFNHPDMIEFLISKGADVNFRSDGCEGYGLTPLHNAVLWGSYAAAEMLINKGANVSASEDHGQTPLHIAVHYENKEMIELLMSKGSDVSAIDISGETPLCMAIEKGNIEIIKASLSKKAINARNKWGWTPLHQAVYMALDKCTDSTGFTKNMREIIELLISNGADVNAKSDCTGDNSQKAGKTPLQIAMWRMGDSSEKVAKEIVEFLISKGANAKVKDESDSTLYVVVGGKRKEMGEVWRQSGVEVNAIDEYGYTPLLWAAEANRIDIVALLLCKGANFDAKDKWGRTPLYWAKKHKNQKMIDLLIAYGAGE